MGPLQVAEKLKEKYPASVLAITEYREQVSVLVKKDEIADMMAWLHDDPETQFNHLADLCGMDYLGKKEPRFEVVYNLYSINLKMLIRIKAEVTEDDCTIDTITPVWQGANWHERECYDMFGIKFNNHPDLRRILLPEDWEGHPLRKDYPLEGPAIEDDWEGYKELLVKSERLKEFDWER